MKHRLLRSCSTALLLYALTACGASQAALPEDEPTPAQAIAQDPSMATPDRMIERAEFLHPAELYQLAAGLLGMEGRADEAVKWFYIGQLRYRFLLMVSEQPSNEQVLFSALSESVGRPINEYAFGDVDAAVAQIDAALAWDQAHDNHFTSKTAHAAELAQVREGLLKLRTEMLTNKEEIRQLRTTNGLPNRTS